MRKKISRLVFLLTIGLTAGAIADQLRRPKAERTWHGTVLGVPYDFRKPSFQRFKEAWWNPNDDRLFTPRDFGIGWAVNLHRLYEILSAPGHNGDG